MGFDRIYVRMILALSSFNLNKNKNRPIMMASEKTSRAAEYQFTYRSIFAWSSVSTYYLMFQDDRYPLFHQIAKSMKLTISQQCLNGFCPNLYQTDCSLITISRRTVDFSRQQTWNNEAFMICTWSKINIEITHYDHFNARELLTAVLRSRKATRKHFSIYFIFKRH